MAGQVSGNSFSGHPRSSGQASVTEQFLLKEIRSLPDFAFCSFMQTDFADGCLGRLKPLYVHLWGHVLALGEEACRLRESGSSEQGDAFCGFFR